MTNHSWYIDYPRETLARLKTALLDMLAKYIQSSRNEVDLIFLFDFKFFAIPYVPNSCFEEIDTMAGWLSRSLSPTVFLTLFLFLYCIRAVLAWSRLKNFKGPWLASFSHLWILKQNMNDEAWGDYKVLHARYGMRDSVSAAGPTS